MKNQLFMRGWKPTFRSFFRRLRINRKVAYELFFCDVFIKFSVSQKSADKLFDKMHKIIEKYLLVKGYLKELDNHLNDAPIRNEDDFAPIWVCWWQGEEAMPDIVKVCYKRIIEFAGKHPVHLVTFDNYKNYVKFSPAVISKFKNKELLPAHLADLLRLKLLDSYGGLWLDATIFLSNPLDEHVFDYDFYSLSNECKNHISVSNFRWCSFVLGCKKRNPLVHALAVTFEKYIEQENYFIHYLVIDYFIDMLYKHNSKIKSLIDNLPTGGKYLHTLRELYPKPFDSNAFNRMLADTEYFKLTYKENIVERTPNNESTFYSHLKNMK